MNKLWDKFLLGLSCCAFMLAEGTDPSNITTLLLLLATQNPKNAKIRNNTKLA